MKKPISLFIAAVLLLCAISAFADIPAPNFQRKPTVIFFSYGGHDVFKRIIANCTKSLRAKYGADINVVINDAELDKSRLMENANRLIGRGNKVVVTVGTPASLAVLEKNTSRIPHVFSHISRPEQLGYTGPGSIKNVTGVRNETGYDQSAALIKKLVPDVKTVGIPVSDEPNAQDFFFRFKQTLEKKGINVMTVQVGDKGDIIKAADDLSSKVDCFWVGGDYLVLRNIKVLVDAAGAHNKPVFTIDESSIKNGVAAAVVIDDAVVAEKTAKIVSKILDGQNPSSIRPATVDRFKIIINKKVCEELSLSIGPDLMKKAVLFP